MPDENGASSDGPLSLAVVLTVSSAPLSARPADMCFVSCITTAAWRESGVVTQADGGDGVPPMDEIATTRKRYFTPDDKPVTTTFVIVGGT